MQVILRSVGGCSIRRADVSDIVPVMEVNLRTLPEHYSDYFYEAILSELPEAFLVAEADGRHVGYIMCKIEHGFSNFKRLGFVKKGHMVSVAVLDRYRRGGIGRALVEEATKGIAMRGCDEFYLEVRCSNTGAVKLYEDLGFEVRQRLGAYYKDGEDAYLMSLEMN